MTRTTEYVILRRLEPGSAVPDGVACYAVEARQHAVNAEGAARQAAKGLGVEKPTGVLPVAARGWGDELTLEPDNEPRWKVHRASDIKTGAAALDKQRVAGKS